MGLQKSNKMGLQKSLIPFLDPKLDYELRILLIPDIFSPVSSNITLSETTNQSTQPIN